MLTLLYNQPTSFPPVHVQLVAALFKPPSCVLVMMTESCHMDPKQRVLGQATKAV